MTGRDESPEGARESGLQSFDDFELTLGDIMRGERATLGKSLLDVQRDIKIKAEYIAAIEETDLSAFETPGFIGGYVKSYARYLGMNPDWVYRTFCDQSGFSHVGGLEAQIYVTPKSLQSRDAKRQKLGQRNDAGDAILSRSPLFAAPTPGLLSGIRPSAIGSMIVLAGMIMGLGYGGWSLLQQIQRVDLAPVETALTISSTDSVDTDAPLIAENTPPTPEALDSLYRSQALEHPVVVHRDAPIATLDPSEQGLYAGYVEPKAQLVVQQTPDVDTQLRQLLPSEFIQASLAEATTIADSDSQTEVQVTRTPSPDVMLFARQPVWVRVRGADGVVLFEKILESGQHYVLPRTEEPPQLRAGNSGSLFFAVNGVTLGPAGEGTSIAKNVVLSPDALEERYSIADLAQDPELARLAELAITSEQETPTADD